MMALDQRPGACGDVYGASCAGIQDDELVSLRALFAEQQGVVEAMRDEIESRPELRGQAVNGRRFLAEALARLEDYRRQAGDMIERVETTRKDGGLCVTWIGWLKEVIDKTEKQNSHDYILLPLFFSVISPLFYSPRIAFK